SEGPRALSPVPQPRSTTSPGPFPSRRWSSAPGPSSAVGYQLKASSYQAARPSYREDLAMSTSWQTAVPASPKIFWINHGKWVDSMTPCDYTRTRVRSRRDAHPPRRGETLRRRVRRRPADGRPSRAGGEGRRRRPEHAGG